MTGCKLSSCRQRYIQKIKASALLKCCGLSKDFSLEIIKRIDLVLNNRSALEAIMLPLSLSAESNNLQKPEIIQSAEANMWGWIHWTILDSITDKKHITLGNLLIQQFSKSIFDNIYYNIFLKKGYLNLYKETNNKIYNAIRIENKSYFTSKNNHIVVSKNNLRRDKIQYKVLRNKSLMYMFTLIIVSKKHRLNLKRFIESFISAKQLSDDSCDWKEDLFEKRKTIVTSSILLKYAQMYHKTKKIDVKQSIGKLNHIFSRYTTHEMRVLINKYLNTSRVFLNKIPSLSKNYELVNMINRYVP